MKTIEMYEANDGNVYRCKFDAEKADTDLLLYRLVHAVTKVDHRQELMTQCFRFLIESNFNLWHLASDLVRIRKAYRNLAKDEIPF